MGLSKIPKLLVWFANGVVFAILIIWVTGLFLPIEPESADSGPEPVTVGQIDPVNDSLPLDEIDNGLLAGRCEWALEHYLNITEASHSDEITVRIAMAAEACQQTELATSTYSTLATESQSHSIQAIARIGLARCLIQKGEKHSAVTSLWQMILKQNSIGSQLVLAEANHLLGLIYSSNLLQVDQLDLLDTRFPAMALMDLDPIGFFPGAFAHLAKNDDSRTDGDDTNFRLRVNTLGDEIPSLFLTSLDVDARSVSKLAVLKSVGDQLGREVMLTDNAIEVLRHHSVNLHASDLDCSKFLDGVLASHGLLWQDNKNELLIFTPDESGDFDASAFEYRRTVALLHDATIGFPEHRLAPLSNLATANLLFANKDFPGAAAIYQEILRKRPNANVQQIASFNLGKAQLQIGQNTNALTSFLNAVDSAAGGQISVATLLVLSELSIEAGELLEAIRFSSQAISMASSKLRDSDVLLQKAVILLASSYLLDKKPYAANRVLVENRSLVRDEQYLDLAATLSAMARFQIRGAADRTAEASDLLRAINNLEVQYPNISFIHLLIAEGQNDLGFITEAIRSLRIGLTHMPTCELRKRMVSRLSDILMENDRAQEVIQLVQTVSVDESSKTNADRILRLAAIHCNDGNNNKCLEECERVIQLTNDEVALKKALQLMGHVHEQNGDYYKAALCFAGVIPTSLIKEKGN